MGKENEIAVKLKEGGVILPLFGTGCLLSTKEEAIIRLLGNAYRLISRKDLSEKAFSLTELLNLPVVVITEKGGPGWALAPAGLLEAVVSQIDEPVWFGIPEEPKMLEEVIETAGKWIKLNLNREKSNKSGPTVIDLSAETPAVLQKGSIGVFELKQMLKSKVRLGPKVILSVLVVCTGNSCRSPLAAALLAQACTGLPVIVSSAGVAAPVGNPATQFTIAVGKELGVDLTSHRARQVDRKMIEEADLILVMEQLQRRLISELVPGAEKKIRLLGGYPEREKEIADPIGHSIEFYRSVALELKSGTLSVADDIKSLTTHR
ncbi:MAG: arsenate reductase/protein-tyrosine-phosphatase family protein [bacterium]